eukprot:scaffold7592_cov43-Attheya_sp.AAC.4
MSSRRRLTIPATPSSSLSSSLTTPGTPMTSNRNRNRVPSAVGVILSSPKRDNNLGVDDQKRRAADRQEQLERWRAQRQQLQTSSSVGTTATTNTNTNTNTNTTATTGTSLGPSSPSSRPSPRSSTTATRRPNESQIITSVTDTANDGTSTTVTAASPTTVGTRPSKQRRNANANVTHEHANNDMNGGGDAETEQIQALSRQVESMVANMDALTMVRDSKRYAHPQPVETPSSPPKIVSPKFTTHATTTLMNGRTSNINSSNSNSKRRPMTSIRTDLDHTAVSAVPLSSSNRNDDKDNVDYDNPLAEYLHQQNGGNHHDDGAAATVGTTAMEDDNRSKTSRTTLHTMASESHVGGSVKRPFESHHVDDTAVPPTNRHRPGPGGRIMPVISIQVETTTTSTSTSKKAARPSPPQQHHKQQQQQQQQQPAKQQTTQDEFLSPTLGSIDHPTQQQHQQQRISPSYDPHRPVLSPKDPEMTYFNSSTPTPTPTLPPTLTPSRASSRFDQIPVPPPDLQDTGGNSSSPRYPSHRPNTNASVLPPQSSNNRMTGGGISSSPKKESPYYNHAHTNGFAPAPSVLPPQSPNRMSGGGVSSPPKKESPYYNHAHTNGFAPAHAAAGVSSSASVTSLTTHRGSVHRGIGGAGAVGGSGGGAGTMVGGEFRESIRSMMHGISDQLVSIHRAAHAREGFGDVIDEDATSYNTRAMAWRQQHPEHPHHHHHSQHQRHHPDNSDAERQMRQTTARLEETLALIEGKAEAMVQVLELNDARTAALERENEQLRGRMHQILVQLGANPTKEALFAATGRLLELNQPPPPPYPLDDSRSIVSLPLPPNDAQQHQQALIPSPPRRMQHQQQQQQHPPRDEWLLGSSDRPRGMSGPTGGHDPHSNNVYRGEAAAGGGGGGYSDFNLAPTFSYESSANNYPPPPRRTSPPDHNRDDARYYDPRHNHHHNSTSPDRFVGGEAAAAAYSYSTTTHNTAQQHTDYPEVNQTKGTMFVTELSELMELDSGDHARLANILDVRWTGHGSSSNSGNNPNPTTSRGTTPTATGTGTSTAGRPTSTDYAPPIPNGSYPRRTPTFSSQPPPPPQSHPQHSPPHHHPQQQPSQPRNQQYNPYNRNY